MMEAYEAFQKSDISAVEDCCRDGQFSEIEGYVLQRTKSGCEDGVPTGGADVVVVE